MALRIIVTAGGTVESIDSVRTLSSLELDGEPGREIPRLTHDDISNISRGGFLYEIALALCSKDIENRVTLIGRTDLIKEVSSSPQPSNLTIVAFRSFNELHTALHEEMARAAADIIVMGAAVSDYSPVAVEGKISSDSDEMLIRLKRNPKILDELRRLAGPEALIVGFKLLIGVSHEYLTEVARRQALRSDSDLTVANDAKEIDWKRGWHPVTVVSQEGLLWKMADFRPPTAARLAHEFISTLECKRGLLPDLWI